MTELSDDLWVKLDVPKVEKILNNLISNALKYSSNGDKISLLLRTISTNHIEISISDTGKGIPKTDLSLIFDRFTIWQKT